MLEANETRAAVAAEAAEAAAAEVAAELEARLQALKEERDTIEASAVRQRSEAQQELAVASAKAKKLQEEIRQMHEQVSIDF